MNDGTNLREGAAAALEYARTVLGKRDITSVIKTGNEGSVRVATKLGARYGSAGWYAPPGVDLSAFGERGWLTEAPPESPNCPLNA